MYLPTLKIYERSGFCRVCSEKSIISDYSLYRCKKTAPVPLLILIGLALSVTAIAKQHVKDITFMLRVKWLFTMEVFPLLPVISVGIINQKKKELLHRTLLLKVLQYVT